ncbi:MAG TPA: mycothiol synthase [Ilumatobacteraceae bacterium]|nr:mycothiol synthase [Ilumatobacteraceae bacterium]
MLVDTRLSLDAGVDAGLIREVDALLQRVEGERGYRPVSDQWWLELHHPPPGVTAVTVRDVAGALIGFALAAHHPADDGHGAWAFETVTTEAIGRAGVLDALAGALVDAASAAGVHELTWTVQGPTSDHDRAAARHGLQPVRHLHQMRRALPIEMPFDFTTRAFDPERDIDAWVAVNARSFAWNPEQGRWTPDDVRARMAEPWFDAAGLLVHERDGRMAGFCWTKIHPAQADDPAMGEIYVVAVDPDFQGLGLGRDLTLAGLAHLAASGPRVAMLFVDADNVAAIRVYERLGFVIHRTDTIFQGTIVQGTISPDPAS